MPSERSLIPPEFPLSASSTMKRRKRVYRLLPLKCGSSKILSSCLRTLVKSSSLAGVHGVSRLSILRSGIPILHSIQLRKTSSSACEPKYILQAIRLSGVLPAAQVLTSLILSALDGLTKPNGGTLRYALHSAPVLRNDWLRPV